LVSSENWFIKRWCSQTVELCWDFQDGIILGKWDSAEFWWNLYKKKLFENFQYIAKKNVEKSGLLQQTFISRGLHYTSQLLLLSSFIYSFSPWFPSLIKILLLSVSHLHRGLHIGYTSLAYMWMNKFYLLIMLSDP
jgi:hypothetical protein